MNELKKSTIRSAIWSMVERFSVQGVQFILSFFIARQLSPSDYGLMAMLFIFMALAQLFVDSGFSNALIQKQDRTDVDFSTVFYFNIVVSLVLYLVLQFCAPYIASFYNQPQLVDMIVFVAFNFVISSFATVRRAKLIINLDFRRQAFISLISVIFSGLVAVYMAYHGYGVWTLVVQGLLNNVISVILLWITTKWHPLFVFSMTSFKELFSFGSKLLVGGVIQVVYTNFYTLLIGKFFTTQDLGLFTRAQQTTQIPSNQLTQVLVRVTYPVECRLQNDDDALSEKFFLFIRLTAYGIFPLMVGVAVFSEPLVRIVLTDKWIACVPLMQILCFAYMFDPIMRMNWDILNVKHRSDYSLKSEIIKKVVAFIILFVTFPFGIQVMCLGVIGYAVSDMFIIMKFTKKILPAINLKTEIRLLAPILGISLLSGTCSYSVHLFIHNDWLLLLLGGSVFLFTYVLFSKIFKMFEFEYLVSLFIKQIIQNRK